MQWKAEGCYRVQNKNKVLVKKFVTIEVSSSSYSYSFRKYPETFFNIVKELAEKEGFEVFGIGDMKAITIHSMR